MAWDFFSVVLTFGVIQGVILTLLLSFSNGPQNRYLAIVLGVFTFSSIVTLFWEIGYIEKFPHLIGVTTPLYYLLGPAFWFYIRSIFSDSVTAKSMVLHTIPFALCLVLISPFYFESTDYKLNYVHAHLASDDINMPGIRGLYYGLFLVQLIGYLIATRLYSCKISAVTSQQKQWKGWIIFMQRGLEIIAIAYFLVFLVYLFTGIITVILRDSLLLIVTFFIHYVAYLNIARSKSFDWPRIKIGAQGSDSVELKRRIEQLISKEERFLDPDLKMHQVAKSLSISPQRLSEIINTEFMMNFSDYVNQYRVTRAKELLANSKFDFYDMDGIAEHCGFNGRINLSRVFKKLTGQTPTSFKQNARRTGL